MAIGFFTDGINFELPHPVIPMRTIVLVCEVVKKAWRLLEEKPPSNFILQYADEDTITHELHWIIENRLRETGEVQGFDEQLFGEVTREPKKTNFNKEHPDKMPDIFFKLIGRKKTIRDQDGLFVECKPVDGDHLVLSTYCKKGLIRFVNGDYAWAMQEALMVGYATEKYTFKKLASVLNDNRKTAFYKPPAIPWIKLGSTNQTTKGILSGRITGVKPAR